MFRNKIYNAFIISIIIIFTLISFGQAEYLKIGHKGPEVKKIQRILNELGYDLKVDGIYGSHTKNIIENFQLNHHLKTDGIVGNNTIQVLQNYSNDIKYTVKKGDCLSEIALKFNTTVEKLINRNNLHSEKIKIDQKLYIPRTGQGGGDEGEILSTITYKVNKGDNLSDIAAKYNISVNKIKEVNNLHRDRIYIGEELIIPFTNNTSEKSIVWPTTGRISSEYGYRSDPITHKRKFHGGIDIAVPVGTRVRAILNGTIVWSGWVDGFGKTIIIDHGNGLKTLYGHNSRLLVNSGSKVHQNQVISLSGNTGRSTGPHLDFRIYLNGKTINPKRYLPKI